MNLRNYRVVVPKAWSPTKGHAKGSFASRGLRQVEFSVVWCFNVPVLTVNAVLLGRCSD